MTDNNDPDKNEITVETASDTLESKKETRNDDLLKEPVSLVTKKKHHYLILAGLLVVVAIAVIFAITISTMSVNLNFPPIAGVSYPYTTTYSVEMEEGVAHEIGGIPIVFISVDDEIFLKVGEEKVRMEIGEKKKITERRAKITTLGFLVFDTNFMILAQYLGMSDTDAIFHISLKTSEQVPGYLMDRILPADITAVPV